MAKRIRDAHVLLTEEEEVEVNEYRKHIEQTLGVRQTFSDAVRALMKRGYGNFKREVAAKKKKVS